jgi:hypothetical protein
MQERVKTLDYYVKMALRDFTKKGDYALNLPESYHTLVVGSQTAYWAGRIVYRFAGKRFSHAKEVLAQQEIDTKRDILEDVTIVSAGGGRNIVPVARYALQKGLRVNTIVCNPNSELNSEFGTHPRYREILVPAIDEPPTVNTATYGGMIRGVTHEGASVIRQVVESLKEPKGGYGSYKAFTVILPDGMLEVAEMVDWKLRGEKIGRCVGTTSVYLTNFMHGAGVTDAKMRKELYIALGLNKKETKVFDRVFKKVPKTRRHYVVVPAGFGPLGYMMVGYAVVGQIQKKYPAFQRNVWAYKRGTRGWPWLSPIR